MLLYLNNAPGTTFGFAGSAAVVVVLPDPVDAELALLSAAASRAAFASDDAHTYMEVRTRG